MTSKLTLRFRDLVTEPGGTIREHQRVLGQCGHVWWGWWMRQYEKVPRELFASLIEEIQGHQMLPGLLFDSGQGQMYSCTLGDIRVAPGPVDLGPPEPECSPEYYQRGRYPAWFRLHSIEELDWSPGRLRFESFPTRPENHESGTLLRKQIEAPTDLRASDATLWILDEESSPGS